VYPEGFRKQSTAWRGQREREREREEVYLQNALSVHMYSHDLHGPVQQLFPARNLDPLVFQAPNSELMWVLPPGRKARRSLPFKGYITLGL
jgi:hypothetical protein